ncbi:MAG: TlyA family RNA methyltransferase [Acidimicrobiales bacterium]
MTQATRRRLDLEMVRRGLVPSRHLAQEAIAAGTVLVGGAVATKASRLVHPSEALELTRPSSPFVSRGGFKLAAALDYFAIDPSGAMALDAGASTGGFTDCMLQRGARRVVAVDVGYGQIHERLRADDRISVQERTNIRNYVTDEAPFDLVVADLSFISLALVAPALMRLAGPGAALVVLVKPQFEAGRSEVSRGRGVISDPKLWEQAVSDVAARMAASGAVIMGAMVSPLRGADGNTEFLLYCRAPGNGEGGPGGKEPAQVAREALAQALARLT